MKENLIQTMYSTTTVNVDPFSVYTCREIKSAQNSWNPRQHLRAFQISLCD